MSRKAYEDLTIEPDFTDPPTYGLAGAGGRRDTAVGQGQQYAAWRGSTQLALGFGFRCSSNVEATALREALNRIRGRSSAFYLPSWQRDFRLAASATAGDTTISIIDGGLSDMTTNRPDTEGRVIFVATPAGSVQILGVETAVDDGANETLTLDQPLRFDLDQSRDMIGFAYLVRLAADEATWDYDAPGQASIPLRFVTVKNRREVDTADTVASEQIGELHAAEIVVATDEDPVLVQFLTPSAIGPNVYGAAQAQNYSATWTASFIDDTTVEIVQADTLETIESTLYDSLSRTDHLTLGFDSAHRELLAWHEPNSRDTIRVRYYAGGAEQDIEFTGISPIAFNTWAIDGTVTLGEAETVVFYLKRGSSSIYFRREAESYATENIYLYSPVPPLYLHKAEVNGRVIDLYGMDASHRAAIWTSSEYEPPLIESNQPIISVIEGVYLQVAVLAELGEEANDPTLSIVDSEYRPTAVEVEAEERNYPALTVVEAAYIDATIVATVSDETPSIGLELIESEHNLITIGSEDIDETHDPAISIVEGIYEQP